jgi:diadenosine tetraphosphate (Ap4A) HIT family hydrolase
MASGCPFCGRVERGECDVDFAWPLDVVSFEPLNPVTPGHRLFLPLRHIEHPHAPATGRCMVAAEWWAEKQGEDFNLITSSGAHATQTVPHIHVHYVPRREGDGLHLPWANQKPGEQHG